MVGMAVAGRIAFGGFGPLGLTMRSGKSCGGAVVSVNSLIESVLLISDIKPSVRKRIPKNRTIIVTIVSRTFDITFYLENIAWR